MNKVLIHESGNISLMQGSFQLEIKNADGTIDPIIETKEAKDLTDEQFIEKFVDPANYDIEKFTGRTLEEKPLDA